MRRPTTSSSSTGPDSVDAVDRPRPDQGGLALADHAVASTRRWRRCARLRERFPALQDPPSDDICYATQNRQVAVKEMAPECDLVIVVGSRNSSNSVRLVEVALDAGARRRTWSTTRARSTPRGSTGCARSGLTSGASVPEVLVRGVLDLLAEHGFADVQPVTTANETPGLRAAARVARVAALTGASALVRQPLPHDGYRTGASALVR